LTKELPDYPTQNQYDVILTKPRGLWAAKPHPLSP
jgi:hypothetical protein